MKSYKKLKGFTLIELMACVAIFAILTTTLGLFFESMLKLYNIQEANTTIEYDARRVMTSITQDVRAAASIPDTGTNSNKLILNNADGSVMATYSLDPNSTNTLDKSGKEIANDISYAFFKVDSKTDPNTVYVTITAQKKNTSEKFTISSSVRRPSEETIAMETPPVPTPTPTPTPSSNMDLEFFEKNVLNVISPNDFSLNNVTINTGSNENLFFECKTFSCNQFDGSNIHGNLAIKADSMNWYQNKLATVSGKDAVFDVASFSGTPNGLNSTNYGSNPNGPDGVKSNGLTWYPISQYPSSNFWSDAIDPNNKNSIKAMSLNTLKPSIDFSQSNIKNSIHYFTGLNSSNNEIAAGVPKPLPDYKGTVQACSINLSNYEYIICHGPLTISSKDSNGNYDWNKNFNFKGLIYCDDTITFKEITPAFTGIIISKGINVDSPQRQNWNDGNGGTSGINFDNNNGNLTDINSILEADTISSN